MQPSESGLDSYGRTAREPAQPVRRSKLLDRPEIIRDEELRPERKIFGGKPELTLDFTGDDGTEDFETKKNAKGIIKELVDIRLSTTRFTQDDIRRCSQALFASFSKCSEILVQVFHEVAFKLPPQVEIVAALIAWYSFKYNDVLTRLVKEKLPGSIVDAFRKEEFRSIKLILRFFGALVAYGLVSVDSYAKLLTDISEMLTSASTCRGEGLARALIVAIKMKPASLPEETVAIVMDKIDAYLKNRDESLVERCSPFKSKSTIVDMLKNATYYSLADDYISMFDACTAEVKAELSWPLDIPDLKGQMVFAPDLDLAPFPCIIIKEVAREDELWNGVSPLITDIADDILVYFGEDKKAVIEQMARLPLLVGYTSLCRDQDSQSMYVLRIFMIVLMSDVLRIPKPYYPTAFHASIAHDAIKLGRECNIRFEDMIAYSILNLLEDIHRIDVGCVDALLKFFLYWISMVGFSFCWDECVKYTVEPYDAEHDPHKAFMRNLIKMCMFVFNPNILKNRVFGERFAHILPNTAEMRFPDDDGSFKTQREELLEMMQNPETTSEQITARIEQLARSEIGEYDTPRMFIYNICQAGSGSVSPTIMTIKRWKAVFRNLFTVATKDDDWKQQTLYRTLAAVYVDMVPVFEELVTYLLWKDYCDHSGFLSYFFDVSGRVKVATNPDEWSTFQVVMDAAVLVNIEKGHVKAAQTVVKDLFSKAKKFIEYEEDGKRIIEHMDENSKRAFVGNLIVFGRKHYNLCAKCGLGDLITGGDTSPEFQEIIGTIESFTSA